MEKNDYECEERIAIRVDSGMPESSAIALTDAENQSKSMLKRVAAMAAHQRENAPAVPLTLPTHEPVLDRKSIAAGAENE